MKIFIAPDPETEENAYAFTEEQLREKFGTENPTPEQIVGQYCTITLKPFLSFGDVKRMRASATTIDPALGLPIMDDDEYNVYQMLGAVTGWTLHEVNPKWTLTYEGICQLPISVSYTLMNALSRRLVGKLHPSFR